MAKRFSDTDKWKKPFIRGLQGAYKLFWFYILDDCDHAGIWHVDFEVAEIRIGEKLNEKKALEIFADKIQVINGGSKWFIRDFVDFQYGELKPNNRLHVSVLNVLEKNGLGDYKPLARGQGQGTIQGQGKGEGQGQDQGEGDPEILNEYDNWTKMIVEGNDQLFEQMFMNEHIPTSGNIQHWILDHRDLLNRYPKMRPPNQNAFRNSCIKHIRENYKKQINGNGINKKTADDNATADYLRKHYSAKLKQQ